jgi:hypothetical protein
MIITIALFLASLAGQAAAPVPTAKPIAAPAAYCHQEILCGPVGGCRWVWVCN